MYWTQCDMGLFIESVRGAAYKPGWHFTGPLGYVVYMPIDLWYRPVYKKDILVHPHNCCLSISDSQKDTGKK